MVTLSPCLFISVSVFCCVFCSWPSALQMQVYPKSFPLVFSSFLYYITFPVPFFYYSLSLHHQSLPQMHGHSFSLALITGFWVYLGVLHIPDPVGQKEQENRWHSWGDIYHKDLQFLSCVIEINTYVLFPFFLLTCLMARTIHYSCLYPSTHAFTNRCLVGTHCVPGCALEFWEHEG